MLSLLSVGAIFSLQAVPGVISCADGVWCNEVLAVRFRNVPSNLKCTLWIYALAPELFMGELNVPVARRMLASDYCPVSCARCIPTTTKKTTIKTTTKPTKTVKGTTRVTTTPTTVKTTLAPEKAYEKAMETDDNFKSLMANLHIENSSDGAIRYELYVKSNVEVLEHNSLYDKGLSAYKKAINEFSVALPEEIPPNELMLPPASEVQSVVARRKRSTVESVDWRPHMKDIKNQGNCGGCWAFAMSAMIEGTLSLADISINGSISNQQLLDCDREVNPKYNLRNAGCKGGYFQISNEYFKKSGITSELIYPFRSSSQCSLPTRAIIPKLKSFDSDYIVAKDSDTIEALNINMERRVSLGPVAVGMAISNDIYSYGEGIFDGNCGKTINHAVVIVGYTPEYWIIRNSWGLNWGERGHIRIARKTGEDTCMLVQYFSLVTEIGAWNIEELPSFSNSTMVPGQHYVQPGCCEDDCCECCDDCDCDDEEEENYDINGLESSYFSSSTLSTNVYSPTVHSNTA